MSIKYVIGDATEPQGDGNNIIVHCCNDRGFWGSGFVLAISARWPEPEAAYRSWYAADRPEPQFELGKVQFILVRRELWVANLIGQHNIRYQVGLPPVRYWAIAQGLESVATFAREHNASVHMPRIGCGLAGGTWNKVEPIIEEKLIENDVAVTVYDLKRQP